MPRQLERAAKRQVSPQTSLMNCGDSSFYVRVLVVFFPSVKKPESTQADRDDCGPEDSEQAVRAPPSRRRAGLSGGTARLTAPPRPSPYSRPLRRTPKMWCSAPQGEAPPRARRSAERRGLRASNESRLGRAAALRQAGGARPRPACGGGAGPRGAAMLSPSTWLLPLSRTKCRRDCSSTHSVRSL